MLVYERNLDILNLSYLNSQKEDVLDLHRSKNLIIEASAVYSAVQNIIAMLVLAACVLNWSTTERISMAPVQGGLEHSGRVPCFGT